MNTELPKDEVDRPAIDTAAAGDQAAALATGPMFTDDDTTDNPGVASGGEPAPGTGHDRPTGDLDPHGGMAEPPEDAPPP